MILLRSFYTEGMKRTKGIQKCTRNKLSKNVREKGLPTISRIIGDFNIGDKVAVKLEPSTPKGRPNPKYQGITGEIIEKRGFAYIIKIKDGNKQKLLISRPAHIKKVSQ